MAGGKKGFLITFRGRLYRDRLRHVLGGQRLFFQLAKIRGAVEPIRSAEVSFCTNEPLGPGGDPYPAMHGIQDPAVLDLLVSERAGYFRQRESAIRYPLAQILLN